MNRRKFFGSSIGIPAVFSLGGLLKLFPGDAKYKSWKWSDLWNHSPGNVYPLLDNGVLFSMPHETYISMAQHLEVLIAEGSPENMEDGYFYSGHHLDHALGEYLKDHNIRVESGYAKHMTLKMLTLTKSGERFNIESSDKKLNLLMGIALIKRLGDEILKEPDKYYVTDGVIQIGMFKLFIRRNNYQVSSVLMMHADRNSEQSYRLTTKYDLEDGTKVPPMDVRVL